MSLICHLFPTFRHIYELSVKMSLEIVSSVVNCQKYLQSDTVGLHNDHLIKKM